MLKLVVTRKALIYSKNMFESSILKATFTKFTLFVYIWFALAFLCMSSSINEEVEINKIY